MTMEQERRTISEYYQGKTILVTGASGFIGKVLIWKLLHHCPSVDTIYVLVRPKYGKNVQLRVDELLRTPIFDSFKKDDPEILHKIKAVAGDIVEDRLGLSEEDEEKLVRSVHIIFHVAATVRFEESLRDAVRMNVGGTLRILELASKMFNLEALVHTSTTYCYCDIKVLEEKPYKTYESPQQIMDMVEWMEPKTLESIENILIKPHPNTYTYSKRLAENLVMDYFPKLPIAIARPSVVTPSLHEPFPGWIDNKNGLVGIMIAGAKGVLRVLWCNGDRHPDVIPVDILCNGLITVAWKTGKDTRRPEKIPVYNLAQQDMKPITFEEIKKLGLRVGMRYPFSVVLWYPDSVSHPNFYVYSVLTFFFQWIPAYLIDAVLFLLGRKTFLVQVQRKLQNGMKMYYYFGTREWNFLTNNILQVRQELSEEDRKIFKLTNKDINVDEYLKNAVLVSRWYLLKEDPANLPTARFRLKILYVLHCFTRFLFYFFIGWLLLHLVHKLYPAFK